MAVGCFGDLSSCGAAGDRGHTIYYYTYINSLAVFEFSFSGSSVLRCVSGAIQRINILLHAPSGPLVPRLTFEVPSGPLLGARAQFGAPKKIPGA